MFLLVFHTSETPWMTKSDQKSPKIGQHSPKPIFLEPIEYEKKQLFSEQIGLDVIGLGLNTALTETRKQPKKNT